MSSYENGVSAADFLGDREEGQPGDREEDVCAGHRADTLAELSAEGIDRKALQAGINYYEFKYREADFGSYPEGTDVWSPGVWTAGCMMSRLPFMHLEANWIPLPSYLKEKLRYGLF